MITKETNTALSLISVNQSGTDLNDYRAEGIYFFAYNQRPTNKPADAHGNGWCMILPTTVAGDAYATQVWLSFGSNATSLNNRPIFRRTYFNGTWSEWVRIPVTGDYATPADLAAVASDVTTLQGDVTTLGTDVTTLQGDVTSLDGRVTTLEQGGGGGGLARYRLTNTEEIDLVFDTSYSVAGASITTAEIMICSGMVSMYLTCQNNGQQKGSPSSNLNTIMFTLPPLKHFRPIRPTFTNFASYAFPLSVVLHNGGGIDVRKSVGGFTDVSTIAANETFNLSIAAYASVDATDLELVDSVLGSYKMRLPANTFTPQGGE